MTVNDNPFWGAAPATSAKQTADAMNAACQTRGGVYAQYRCAYVSWDDVSRTKATTGGLSITGRNISDTYLCGKDGQSFFTLRPSNWNEKLGRISSSDLAVITGNHQVVNQGFGATAPPLRAVTLRDVLEHMGEYGAYAGMLPGINLHKEALDHQVSIRFQTTFLPAPKQTLPDRKSVV